MDQEDPGGTREGSCRSWDTPFKEGAPGSYSRAGAPDPSSSPYSPKCLEEEFPEVHLQDSG
jgi:hypothetical protein